MIDTWMQHTLHNIKSLSSFSFSWFLLHISTSKATIITQQQITKTSQKWSTRFEVKLIIFNSYNYPLINGLRNIRRQNKKDKEIHHHSFKTTNQATKSKNKELLKILLCDQENNKKTNLKPISHNTPKVGHDVHKQHCLYSTYF